MGVDVYQIVTDQIVELLEQGTVPWRIPYRGNSGGHPRNLKSNRPYRGINVFLLAVEAWTKGYESACWLTFKQAKEKGGAVRKGEKSSLVVFWKQMEVEDKDTGEPTTIPVLRYYRVFNVAQCENIEAPDVEAYEPLNFTPIQAAQRIVDGYHDAPAIEQSGSVPCYQPVGDVVRMPEPQRFVSAEEYHSCLFHELAHSTGHSKRLNRGLDKQTARFDRQSYSKEELVAEMASAYLCNHAGIGPATIDNTAAYLQGWLKQLKDDKRLIVHAAGAAQKAADWILGQYRETNVK